MRIAVQEAPPASPEQSAAFRAHRQQAACKGLTLEQGIRPDYAAVKALAAPEKTTVPVVHIPEPDFAEYDRLLVGGAS